MVVDEEVAAVEASGVVAQDAVEVVLVGVVLVAIVGVVFLLVVAIVGEIVVGATVAGVAEGPKNLESERPLGGREHQGGHFWPIFLLSLQH